MFCDTEKYEELEMDTHFLYLALSGENLGDNIFAGKRNEWEALRSPDCTDSFTANATGNFLPRICCTAHKRHRKREPGLFRKNSGFRECWAVVAKHIVARIERVTGDC